MTKHKGQRTKNKSAKRAVHPSRGHAIDLMSSSSDGGDTKPHASGSRPMVAPVDTKRRGSRDAKAVLDHVSFRRLRNLPSRGSLPEKDTRIQQLLEGKDFGKSRNEEVGSLIAAMQVVGLALHTRNLEAKLAGLDSLFELTDRFLAKVGEMVAKAAGMEL